MPQPISQLAEYTSITASAFIPVIDVNENVASKNKKTTIAELRKLFFKNSVNSASFTKHTPGFYYFGDNSDGPGNFSGSITALRTRISGTFASTQDGPPVIKNFSNLFVSRSVTISPPNRCRGLLIFVDGDATISGSITMTARGAKFTGSDASFTVVNPPYLGDYWSTQLFPSASYLSRVFAVGGAGGGSGNDGVTGVNGRSGGGGSGSSFGAPAASVGGTGTSFSGGAGGGGASPSGGVGGTGRANGGAGGNGSNVNAGGGAGNPGGSPNGAIGTGGLLILIVRGNLKIGPNGSINANGSNGGSASSPGSGGGGGGSGGGIIYVYYNGKLTNNGTIAANGGNKGTGGNVAGNGGAGSLTTAKLNTAFPVAN